MLPSPAGKVVLDIACGTGRWLEKLLIAGATAGAGVDFSSAMIDVAGAKPLLQGHLAKGDCLALPFRSESADIIICSFAMAHIDNLEVFAQELARVAKRLAQLCVSDVHPEAYARGWRTGFRYERGSVEIATLPRSIEEIHATFRSHGFELLRCHEPHLGEAEKPIFERARKSHLFDGACQVPAVHVCQFTRSTSERVPCPALI